jgi:hypothetical protein
MGPARCPDHRLQIDVFAIRRESRIEDCRRLATRDPSFVGFERPLDNVGDRSFLAPGQAMGKIARAGAADG